VSLARETLPAPGMRSIPGPVGRSGSSRKSKPCTHVVAGFIPIIGAIYCLNLFTALSPTLSARPLPVSPAKETETTRLPSAASLRHFEALEQLPKGIAKAIRSDLAAGDYSTAAEHLARFLEEAPQPSYELLSFLGSLFFLEERYLNAAVAFKRADAVHPLEPSDRFTLAMAYVLLGRNDWARPELERLSSDDSGNPLYSYWLARLDFDERRYLDALQRLEALVERVPSFVRAVDRLALCYQFLGRYPEAERWFRRAIEQSSQQEAPWEGPYINLATMLLEQERSSEAVALLQEAVRIAPSSSEAHYRLGLAFEKEHQWKEAVAEMRKVVQLDPNHVQAWWALVRILRRAGDEPGAREALRGFQQAQKNSQ